MSRTDTTILKGVAILLMLFYHLFNRIEFCDLCQITFTISGDPLVHIITRAANPVAFFIMLSGYGLYISHKNGTYNVWRKIKMLYTHYWITLLVFVPIGFFIVGSKRYPGSCYDVISNIIGWNVSYNGEIWFLLPFAVLMLISNYIVKLVDKFPAWLCLAVSFCISLGSGWLIPRLDVVFINIVLLVCTFLLAFMLGMYMRKYQKLITAMVNGGGKKLCINNRNFCWFILALLVVFRCLPCANLLHPFYVFGFITLFVNAYRAKWLNAFLLEMGKRSTSMWFVHSYFCYHLFRGFVYSFHYPLLVFSVLLFCSYTSATIIDWLNGKVKSVLFQQ